MNRSGGGQSLGTNVIGYNCGDANNYFGFSPIPGKCGNGHVTSTCPFADHNLDQVLSGYQIARIPAGDISNNYCVGAASSSDQSAKLGECGDSDGNGIGWSGIMVLVGVTSLSTYDGHPIHVVNVHWTDANNGNERYVTGNGYRSPFLLNGGAAAGCPGGGNCQLREAYQSASRNLKPSD
jgi:hypothetical protein